MMGQLNFWFIAVTQFSDDILNKVGIPRCNDSFYYGMTAFACVVYYRRLELKRFRTFVSVGDTAAGGLAMVAILIGACFGMAQESHRVFGVGRPLVLSAAALMVGVAVRSASNVPVLLFLSAVPRGNRQTRVGERPVDTGRLTSACFCRAHATAGHVQHCPGLT